MSRADFAWGQVHATAAQIDEAIAAADGPAVASLFRLLKEELAALKTITEGSE
jgi:hypothetical protein